MTTSEPKTKLVDNLAKGVLVLEQWGQQAQTRPTAVLQLFWPSAQSSLAPD